MKMTHPLTKTTHPLMVTTHFLMKRTMCTLGWTLQKNDVLDFVNDYEEDREICSQEVQPDVQRNHGRPGTWWSVRTRRGLLTSSELQVWNASLTWWSSFVVSDRHLNKPLCIYMYVLWLYELMDALFVLVVVRTNESTMYIWYCLLVTMN